MVGSVNDDVNVRGQFTLAVAVVVGIIILVYVFYVHFFGRAFVLLLFCVQLCICLDNLFFIALVVVNIDLFLEW